MQNNAVKLTDQRIIGLSNDLKGNSFRVSDMMMMTVMINVG